MSMQRVWAAWTAFLAVLLVVVPALVSKGCGSSPRSGAGGTNPSGLEVAVWFPQDRRLVTVPLAHFLIGVVAAEMPPEFADEALKAQMVVARTYTVKHMRRFGGRGCPLHPQADACATPEYGQAYTTLEQLQEKHGYFAAYQYWNRLHQAEAETAGLIVTYEGQPIDALYHSSSGERTESGAAYFGNEVPYLQPVADTWGRQHPRYQETLRLTPEELTQALGLSRVDRREPIRITDRTPSGRVAEVEVGGQVFSGRELRTRLGLRSTQFTAAVRDGSILITTYGYGHGVGMSQYGANGLARRGAGFREIIGHYYQGVEVERIFAD